LKIGPLGTLITNNLKPSRQCHTAYIKASKSLGLIYTTISYENQDILLKLYKTLVCPHLEYCVSAWSAHYVKDKVLVECVKHILTRMIPGLLMREEIVPTFWKFSECSRNCRLQHSATSSLSKLLPTREVTVPRLWRTGVDLIWLV